MYINIRLLPIHRTYHISLSVKVEREIRLERGKGETDFIGLE